MYILIWNKLYFSFSKKRGEIVTSQPYYTSSFEVLIPIDKSLQGCQFPTYIIIYNL